MRAALEKENLAAAKNVFVYMGRNYAVPRAAAVVKTILQKGLLAREDVSHACGSAALAAYLLASKPDAIVECNNAGLFREVLALHLRVCPSELPAEWWSADGSVISNTSTRLAALWFLAQHAKSIPDRESDLHAATWWTPLLRGAIHMVKMNAAAQLCAQKSMSFWPILSSLGVVEAAAKEPSRQEFLLKLGVGEALEYACVNDFTFTGRSVANVAAGAMVALVGRNEGGKTLSQDTVRAVLDFLQLYVFDTVCFVYTCRRLIDFPLIAGTSSRTTRPTVGRLQR